ncbi:MAG: hypothetical protein IKY67_10665 [Paludibacteraceae bacterium]|nr:hypothetical protein [Paludibacteraceae bacterium]
MRRVLSYILLVVGLMSCTSEENCMQDLKFSMKAEIYRMVFDTSIEQFVPEKYSVPISLNGLGRDSLLYDSTFTSTLNIPLQKLDSISSFVLTTTIQVDTSYVTTKDTIDFHHTNSEEFISIECGCIVTNLLTGVAQTTHHIDSIIVVSPEVDLQSKNNIKIYLSQR